MKYVLQNKETKKFIKDADTRLETDTKENAFVFKRKSEFKDYFEVEELKEYNKVPYYLMCKNCKNSKEYFIAGKPYYNCTKIKGLVVPSSTGFINCKHYLLVNKEGAK